MPKPPSTPNPPLPLLRDDLQLVPGMPTAEGEPTWTLIDPIRNQYFQIGWRAFQLLSRWKVGSADQLMAMVSAHTIYQVTRQDLDGFIRFLYTNHLTQEPSTGTSQTFAAQSKARNGHWLSWLVHHYLFFRIPLGRPDRFLKATLPFVTPLWSKIGGSIIGLLGCFGLYLVSRQWDTFIHTFSHAFTLKGMVAFGLAVCGVKIFHELGHAYAAARYGCRVHTMGIAFLVMFPVLYTDTTDVWRLTSRRQRCLINAAGVITELSLAMIATFLWNFVPDGMVRSILFFLATSSWIMSLTINLNPLLRFDGYYLLSDWLGIPNLQQRAFTFGRWKLREWLFALGDPPPESLSPRIQNKLILYAWSTWLFRFFLFLAIALYVYYFFFKLLGLILFAVEITWFLLLPITQEIQEWWKRKDRIVLKRRGWITLTMVVTLTTMAFVPWNTTIAIPAILQAAQHTTIFAPAPSRLVHVAVENGKPVTQGDVLAILESPAIEQEITQIEKQIELLTLRLKRQVSNPRDVANTQVLLEELKTQISEVQGWRERKENLHLKATFSGILTDVQSSLHPGRWVNEKLPLAKLVQPTSQELLAFTPETDLSRLEVGQQAWFIPDDPARPSMRAQVREVRQIDEGASMTPYFASVFGGEIPVRQDDQGNVHPESALYRVTLDVEQGVAPENQAVKGIIHVTGHPQSVVDRLQDVVFAVIIRETGF